MLAVIAAAAVGYMVGSINPAAIIARMRGVDYRSVGSGNPGATNISRALGARTGVLVGLLDVLKGFLPAVAFRYATDNDIAVEVAGFAAVVGHVTSPFLRGRGGKGVATSAGAILAVQPIWLVPILIVFGVILKVSGRMGVASAAAGLTLIPAGLAWHDDTGQLIFAIALSSLIVIRHQSNIRAAIQARLDGPGG